MKFVKDEFDTAILGKNVYKLTLEEGDSPTEIKSLLVSIKDSIVCSFIPALTDYSTSLENLGFHFISIRNTYKYSQSDQGILPNLEAKGFEITSFSPTETITDTEIEHLAVIIGKVNRYYKDSQIPQDKSKQIYIQWIKNSLFQGFASRSFVIRYNKQIVGICTTKIKQTHGEIDLVGILTEHQNKKLGKYLIEQALMYLRENKFYNPLVVTAGENIPANIFFQKTGFVIDKVELVYHKHTDI